MPMRTRLGSIMVVAAAAATVACLGSGPAMAASTWTITPGGAATGTSGTTTLKDTSTGTTLTCKSSTAKATLKSGSGQTNPIGTINTLTFATCTGPLGLTFTVSVTTSPTLTGNSYSGGVTQGTVGKIHANLSGPGCTAEVDGTSATANNGSVNGTYTNSTGNLAILTTGGNLHIYDVSGCFGLVNSGDATTFSATYAISPKQTITSP